MWASLLCCTPGEGASKGGEIKLLVGKVHARFCQNAQDPQAFGQISLITLFRLSYSIDESSSKKLFSITPCMVMVIECMLSLLCFCLKKGFYNRSLTSLLILQVNVAKSLGTHAVQNV